MSQLEQLAGSRGLFELILQKLPLQALGVLQCTCRALRSAVSLAPEELWRQLAQCKLPHHPALASGLRVATYLAQQCLADAALGEQALLVCAARCSSTPVCMLVCPVQAPAAVLVMHSLACAAATAGPSQACMHCLSELHLLRHACLHAGVLCAGSGCRTCHALSGLRCCSCWTAPGDLASASPPSRARQPLPGRCCKGLQRPGPDSGWPPCCAAPARTRGRPNSSAETLP